MYQNIYLQRKLQNIFEEIKEDLKKCITSWVKKTWYYKNVDICEMVIEIKSAITFLG